MIRKVVTILSLVFIGYSSYAVHLVRDTLPSGILSDLNFIEICDNGIDDDNDGFLDSYDSDCPCQDTLFNNSCFNDCQSILIDTSFQLAKKWASDIIGTSIGNILVFDSLIFTKKIEGGYSYFAPESRNSYVKLNGKSGIVLNQNPYSSWSSWPSDYTPLAIFSWRDTIFTVILHRDTLMMFDYNNSKKWESYGFSSFPATSINIVDFNNDGIPEIYVLNKIISIFNGNVIIDDFEIKGINSVGTWFPIGTTPVDWTFQANTQSADLLPITGLELAAGNVVYEVVLNNNLSSSGNQLIPHYADAPVQNGITSVGDIDGDGKLDVIVVRNQYYIDGGGIYVWNPRTGKMIARANSGESGSCPFIGDVDGDCLPEIGVVFAKELRMYKYNGSQNLALMYSLPTSDDSGITGITMFDFNQDGKNELVYRDETTLRVLDGATGRTITSTPMLSTTGMESPVVADVDCDGQAEILTSGYMPGETERDSRVYCFESGGAPWAPARSVWNQYGYHVTNVNDDLTIPRHQQNMAAFFDTDSCAQATCPQPYNAFMTQATYRTQKGCRVWPSLPDLEVSATASCTVDSLDLCFILKGRPDTLMFIPISCYGGGFNSNMPNEPPTRAPLETRIIQNQDTFCFRVPRMIGLDSMVIVINDNGSAGWNPLMPSIFSTDKIECRYDNNTFVIGLPPRLPDIDLGPDLSGCVGKVITLNAETGYTTYLWSDQSTSNRFTTDSSGQYWIEATDACGLVSRDTIQLSITPAFTVSIGDDKNVCPGDDVTLSYTESYDQLFWLPASRVSCDTCAVTTVLGERDTVISLHVIRDGCISSDTMMVNFVDISHVSLGPDLLLCPGLIDSFHVRVPYDSIVWSPISRVTCERCFSTRLLGSDDFVLSVTAYKDGCETRDTVDIAYINQVNVTRRINLCENETFTYGDSTWAQSGTYTYKIGQCDSLLTFEIEIHQTPESSIMRSICAGDSILIGGEWRNAVGIYTEVFESAIGCDSLVRVSLDILPHTTTSESIEICAGKTINIHGIDRTQAGTYTQMFNAGNGCDSTSTVMLTFSPPISRLDSMWICESEVATIHGQVRNTQGLYTQSFKTTEGCDSTSNVYLTVSPYKISTQNHKLCQGDSININGTVIKTAGIYFDTVIINNACDEIVRHEVRVLQHSASMTVLYLCPDSTKIINGQLVTTAGRYIFDQFTNSVGCDSIVTVDVMEVPPSERPKIEVDCDANAYAVIAPNTLEWWYVSPDGNNFDTLTIVQGGKVKIQAKSLHFCDKEYFFNLPPIPSLSDIPKIADLQQSGNTGVTVIIDLPTSEWKVLWSPSALESCDTCMTTTITVDRDTTIQVLLTHTSGCVFEQTFTVTRTPDVSLVIPNIFNPTSTSGNEKWSWTAPEGYKIMQCLIYDRWGNQVYRSTTSETISWNGAYNGNLAISGVYVYFIKLVEPSGTIRILQGDVTMVR